MSDEYTVKIIKDDQSEINFTEEQWESEDNQYFEMESDAEYMISEDISSLQFFKNGQPHGSFYEYFEVENGDYTHHYHYSEYEDGELDGEYIIREDETHGSIIEEANYKNGKLHGLRQLFEPGEYYDEEYGVNIRDERYKDGKLHSLNGKPSQVFYGFIGDYKTQKAKELWHKEGVLHREDGPAVIYHYDPIEYDVEESDYEFGRYQYEFHTEEYWVDGKQIGGPTEDTSQFQVRLNGKGRKISLDKFNEEKDQFFENGIELIEYYKDGELHREDGPACVGIRYGSKIEEWYLNGEQHREDGPAVIEYHYVGRVKREEWYLNGERHREDKPAEISYYKDGSVESEYWCLNGATHREDGPAEISYYKDGSVWSEKWYLNGKKHREDKPAYIVYNNDNGSVWREWWYLNGEEHREDGPAYIEYFHNGNVEDEEWYLYGEELSEEEFNKRCNSK